MRHTRSIAVYDSGLASGVFNHALDRQRLEQCAARNYYDTLRFHRSTPTVSLGLHQALAREVRLEYCAAHNIEIARRCSSGGALYLDADQLGYSLILRRPKTWRDTDLTRCLARFAGAVARGLRLLGINAAVKRPNDIETCGRKLGSVFATLRGQALLLHGTVFMAADVRTMLEALRLPTEKLSPDGLAAARDRVITLDECLQGRVESCELQAALVKAFGDELHLRFRPTHAPVDHAMLDLAGLDAEHAASRSIVWDHDSVQIEGLMRTPGGTLRARAAFAPAGDAFERVELAADAHFEPPGLLAELQDVLRGLPTALLTSCVRHFMRGHAPQTVDWNTDDLLHLLQQLVEKQGLLTRSEFSTAQVNALMPYAAGTPLTTPAILERATAMLVPYCAKPTWCKWRHRDGCTECGKCEVGDAYRLARERGMEVITITTYERLVASLAKLKAANVQAFVGMCCGHFFVKRHRAFAQGGVPAVLMDIGGANCYELRQEAQAYAGTFRAQSQLDGALLGKVMELVPSRSRVTAAAGRKQ